MFVGVTFIMKISLILTKLDNDHTKETNSLKWQKSNYEQTLNIHNEHFLIKTPQMLTTSLSV